MLLQIIIQNEKLSFGYVIYTVISVMNFNFNEITLVTITVH